MIIPDCSFQSPFIKQGITNFVNNLTLCQKLANTGAVCQKECRIGAMYMF
jgi:hypothetical protein